MTIKISCHFLENGGKCSIGYIKNVLFEHKSDISSLLNYVVKILSLN